MGLLYVVFALTVAGAHSSDSYSYPLPQQPLELATSPLASLADIQGYNYPQPAPADTKSVETPVPAPAPQPAPAPGYRYDQPEETNKHVYVYVAPPEPEAAAARQVFVPPPPVNHKIIFIKAPAQPTLRSQVIALPNRQEEKTLVYVLVKKPEEQQIDVQAPPQRPAAKPEVYFIKYDTKKEQDEGGAESRPQPPSPVYGPLPGVVDARRSLRDVRVGAGRARPAGIYSR